jgi:hypothetical protein
MLLKLSFVVVIMSLLFYKVIPDNLVETTAKKNQKLVPVLLLKTNYLRVSTEIIKKKIKNMFIVLIMHHFNS